MNRPKSIKLLKGLNAVELVVVMSLVAILATVALNSYRKYLVEARVSVVNNNLSSTFQEMSENRDAGFNSFVCSGRQCPKGVSSMSVIVLGMAGYGRCRTALYVELDSSVSPSVSGVNSGPDPIGKAYFTVERYYASGADEQRGDASFRYVTNMNIELFRRSMGVGPTAIVEPGPINYGWCGAVGGSSYSPPSNVVEPLRELCNSAPRDNRDYSWNRTMGICCSCNG